MAREGDNLSTVVNVRFDPTPLPEASFVLRVVEGPDAGKRFVLDGSEARHVLLGMSPACDLRLADDTVSRRHASLEIVGARLHLTDLGSSNGTRVGALSVGDAFLEGGETIRIGATVIVVDAEAATPLSVPVNTATRFGRVAGWSRGMRALYPLCARLAASNVPAFLEGETGTGKEVLAESIHEESARAGEPFVVFDCTAVAPSLVESELFGHERGAFTGAVSARKGVFEQAHGGTLFIDEIGDLDLAMQPKLLRALERSEVRRVGGDRWTKVDVRVLAATRRDLDREVQAGRFRDDLFHRLAVARIELPPLRKRRGDVALLANLFAEQLLATAPIPAKVLARWEEYGWPGNVRELRNAVARWLALGEAMPAVRPSGSALPEATAQGAQGDFLEHVLSLKLPMIRARELLVEAFEQRYIERVLEEHEGNVGRAAAASGIARRYFQVIRARAK